MIWYIIGGCLVALGILLTFFYKKQGDKLFLIRATETSLVSNIEQEQKDVTEGMGERGSYSKYTEVKGRVVCENPITSELANARCVYYTMSITRKWEEEYWETDSEGRQQRRTRQGTDTVASNTRHVPFYVKDETGQVKINPEGAEIIAEKSYSSFQHRELQAESRGNRARRGEEDDRLQLRGEHCARGQGRVHSRRGRGFGGHAPVPEAFGEGQEVHRQYEERRGAQTLDPGRHDRHARGERGERDRRNCPHSAQYTRGHSEAVEKRPRFPVRCFYFPWSCPLNGEPRDVLRPGFTRSARVRAAFCRKESL
jgi:hypothetical protein